MHDDLITRLSAVGVVPVVTIALVEHAVPVALALLAGGLSCVEITFRSEAAAESLRRVRREVPEMMVLAGTVLSAEQVTAAIAAGADAIVAPGFNVSVVEQCLDRGVPIVPGIATPTELEMALRRDLRLVKFFPAEPIGGIPYLQALAGPYPAVRFVPTGGISPGNLAAYLALENVAAVGGSWLATPEAVAGGDFAGITARAAEATAVVRGVRSSQLAVKPQVATT